MTSLAKVKLYCKIDVADDDALVTSLITAAESLIREQSGKNAYIGDGSDSPVNIGDTELFQTCVCQLVEHWYDRRGAVDIGQLNDIPFAVDMLIAHFKYSCEYDLLNSEPDPESETEQLSQEEQGDEE